MSMEAFAHMIRTARQRLGISQEELAHVVGTRGNTIWRIEAGRQRPEMELAFKLGDALHLDPRDIKRVVLDQATLDSVAFPDPNGMSDDEISDMLSAIEEVIRQRMKGS